MRPRMLFAMILTAAALVPTTAITEDAARPRDGVFIHVSHGKDDP